MSFIMILCMLGKTVVLQYEVCEKCKCYFTFCLKFFIYVICSYLFSDLKFPEYKDFETSPGTHSQKSDCER